MNIRTATLADVPALAELGAATFIETFGSNYTREHLTAFIANSHSEAAHERAVRDPDFGVWLATDEKGDAIGYAVAGPCKLPIENREPRAGEIHQVYVLERYQGHRLGSRLLTAAFDWLAARDFSPLYVGVWSENVSAQRLYGRFGFEKVAEYGFRVGGHVDRDYIMRRRGTATS